MGTSLRFTPVGSPVGNSQTVDCLHLLAAANHRHWRLWANIAMQHVARDSPLAIEAGLPREVVSILRVCAKTTIDLAEQVVKPFGWPSPSEPMLRHKAAQLSAWIATARDMKPKPEQFDRWRLLRVVRFLELNAQEQAPYYRAAADDLKALADASNLKLPEALPLPSPIEGKKAEIRLRLHLIGLHGDFMVSEARGSRVCVACNAPAKASRH